MVDPDKGEEGILLEAIRAGRQQDAADQFEQEAHERFAPVRKLTQALEDADTTDEVLGQ